MRREIVKHYFLLHPNSFLHFHKKARIFLPSAAGLGFERVRGGAGEADVARWSQQGVNQLEEHAMHATGGLTR